MKLTEPAYTYSAEVIRWVDGDTVDMLIDVGFGMFAKQRLRLHGIDTPERGQRGYSDAIEYVCHHAPPGSHIIVATFKEPEKYGRYLALIYPRDEQRSINGLLVEEGLAVEYDGGRRG